MAGRRPGTPKTGGRKKGTPNKLTALLKDEILATPIEYRDFSLLRPEGPGLGVVLDPDKVAHYDRDRSRSLHRVAGG